MHLVGTLLSLCLMMPDKAKTIAREVVAKVMRGLERKLAQTVQDALSRAGRNPYPSYHEIDWGTPSGPTGDTTSRPTAALFPSSWWATADAAKPSRSLCSASTKAAR